MSDMGCAFTGLLFFLALGVGYVVLRLGAEKVEREKKRARGEQITAVLQNLSRTRDPKQLLEEVGSLLQQPPVGFFPELVAQDGWFNNVTPILTRLLRNGRTSPLVEWYFTCFSFPAGQQGDLLAWLNDRLRNEQPPIAVDLLERVAGQALRDGGAAEADWFYRRTLEVLRTRSQDVAFKTFVL